MIRTISKICLVLLAAFPTFSTICAYPQYNGNVPNGNAVPPSALALGHPNGATKLYTPFANAYVSNGRKWSRGLYIADSDGDGQSNGLKMGDPCFGQVHNRSFRSQLGHLDMHDESKMKNHPCFNVVETLKR